MVGVARGEYGAQARFFCAQVRRAVGNLLLQGLIEAAQRLLRFSAQRREVEICSDACDQLTGAEGLDQVVICAGRKSFDFSLVTGARGQEEHGDIAQFRILAQRREQSEAIELRHHHIRENQVRLAFPRLAQGLFTVAHRLDLKARGLQQLLQICAHVDVIVRNKHPLAGGTGNGCNGTDLRRPRRARARVPRRIAQPT